ncbi:MAG: DUF1905 domain-containing protein [Marmoricola sp.]
MNGWPLVFVGEVIEWRGPAPYLFVAIPVEESEDIKAAAKGMEYWGQVPVTAQIDNHGFSTALFPKDGRYLLPLRGAVRTVVGIVEGDTVQVALRLGREA